MGEREPSSIETPPKFGYSAGVSVLHMTTQLSHQLFYQPSLQPLKLHRKWHPQNQRQSILTFLPGSRAIWIGRARRLCINLPSHSVLGEGPLHCLVHTCVECMACTHPSPLKEVQ